MKERDLRRLLTSVSPPDEGGAGRRAWPIVRAAFEEREPVRRRRSLTRPALALLIAAAVVAAAASSPGRAVLDSLRDAIAPTRVAPSAPALVRLPAAGRLLVNSPAGPWVVQQDGSKRLLGPYREASWSPHGLYIVAARRHELVTVTPAGRVRWTVARRGRVAAPRWAGSRIDTRIGYLAGRTLRVVAGDGSGDRMLDASVEAVAPAWRPGRRFVVAYVDRGGDAVARDADSGRVLWRARGDGPARLLLWRPAGRRLLAVTPDGLTMLGADGLPLRRAAMPGVTAAALAPRGDQLAVVRRLGQERSEVRLLSPATLAGRRVFLGAGDLTDLAWSPDGRWLLVAWRSANQWLFFRPGLPPVESVSHIARQFDPRSRAPVTFPRIDPQGWCCPD
jgi:hypothetical protein